MGPASGAQRSAVVICRGAERDLLHPGGGIGDSNIARPAEFLIDPRGTVRWVNLTESYAIRASAERVLKVLDGLGVTSTDPKK